jgi:hypothetical protein
MGDSMIGQYYFFNVALRLAASGRNLNFSHKLKH